MSQFVEVIEAKDVPLGRAVPVQVGDRWFAVCNDRGTIYVTDILCPHAGGPLGQGEVHRGRLVCPVHLWHWDLKTGLSDLNRSHPRLKIYACQVRDGKVYADVSKPLASQGPSTP